jgi:hypothetical protein
MKVIATIDITRPAGRKIVRELAKKRTVKLEYPLSEEVAAVVAEGQVHTPEYVFGELLDKLSIHYGVNMRDGFKF